MNMLIANPFELKLNTWFEELVSRIAKSASAKESWVTDSLQRLRSTKELVIKGLQENDRDARDLYQKLTRNAKELLEEVSVACGPTAHSWLNRPLRDIYNFLGGRELSKDTSELLHKAFVKVHEQGQQSRLETSLRNLMLWSQGHTILSGLELKKQVEICIAASNIALPQAEAKLSLDQLLNLCESSCEEEQDEYAELFLDKLDTWEDQLCHLETQLMEQGLNTEEILSPLFDAMEILQTAIDNEDLTETIWGTLRKLLGDLRQEWRAVSIRIQLAGQQKAKHTREAARDFAHLETLQGTILNFQNGHINVEQLQMEIKAHRARWSRVSSKLEAALAGQKAQLSLFNSIRLSLDSLKTVNSPCDARLTSISRVYADSLSSLLEKVA